MTIRRATMFPLNMGATLKLRRRAKGRHRYRWLLAGSRVERNRSSS